MSVFSFISNFKSQISNSVLQIQIEKIRVSSKDFTESVILAEILAQMLEKKGIAVERNLELGGNLAHEALLANQSDVYPEYTGTAYTAILEKCTRSPILKRFMIKRKSNMQKNLI